MGISKCPTFYQAKDGTFPLFDLALFFSVYYIITKEWPVVVNGECQSTVWAGKSHNNTSLEDTPKYYWAWREVFTFNSLWQIFFFIDLFNCFFESRQAFIKQ